VTANNLLDYMDTTTPTFHFLYPEYFITP